jgi:hypothetical protein
LTAPIRATLNIRTASIVPVASFEAPPTSAAVRREHYTFRPEVPIGIRA